MAVKKAGVTGTCKDTSRAKNYPDDEKSTPTREGGESDQRIKMRPIGGGGKSKKKFQYTLGRGSKLKLRGGRCQEEDAKVAKTKKGEGRKGFKMKLASLKEGVRGKVGKRC